MFSPGRRPTGDGRSRMIGAKPFDIPKREVWEAFKRVKANQGTAGVDGQSIQDFEDRLGDNLYKLWNRMSSGSYMPPPVRRVDIRKRPEGRGRWGFRRLRTVSGRRLFADTWSRCWNLCSMRIRMDIDPGVPRPTRSGLRVSDAGDMTGSWISTSKASSTVSIMSCCYGLCASTRLVPGCCSTSNAG